MKTTESSETPETTHRVPKLKLYSVESSHISGGPCGVGDPNDKRLRNAELNNIIPKMARERAKEECKPEGKLFGECAKKQGMFLASRCRKEAEALRLCVLDRVDSAEFMQKIKDLYLEQRTYYREHGIPRSDATKRRP